MKKVFLIAALFAGVISANAQKVNEADVPAAVKATLKSKYADVTKVTWEKEKGNYEANFDKGKTEISLLIDPNGKLLETEESIAISSLPQAVSDYITKNLPGKKIKEASKITNVEGTLTYEAEVDGMDYKFDKDGNFISKEADND